MIDFLGKEIHIGDTIVGAIGHGRNSGASLCACSVLKISNVMIKVKIIKSDYQYCHSEGKEFFISSEKVVVV